jgi:hypoxanthine-DNA glycosylase
VSLTQDHSFGFPPVSRGDARILILGSLPGQASLAAQQYYAQPRNAFWPLMGRLFGAGVALPYEDRLRRLTESGVALWDVCASARRPGSLDTRIEAATVAPNDFAGFFQAHRGIGLICFNGAAAERLFERHVSPTLQVSPMLRLPSTSPAHASLSFEQKFEAWSAALAALAETPLSRAAKPR